MLDGAHSVAPLTTPPAAEAIAKLDKTAVKAVGEEFEAVFLSSMIQHMFAGVDTEGPFGGGQAEESWRSLLIEEYGKSIAAAGGIGIADEIVRELLALQEMSRDVE